MTKFKLIFIPVKGKRGINADLNYKPEKLNISGALDLFAVTYEALEALKQDLIENMQFAIEQVKKMFPANFDTWDQYNAWSLKEFHIGAPKMCDKHFAEFMSLKREVQKMMIDEATEGYRRSIKRIVQRQQALMQPLKRHGGVTEDQIAQAKEYPLEELVDRKLFKVRGKWKATCHCPLTGHEGERTPSFYIDKNNRYKCFGCGESGDSIKFVMQRDNVGFVTAVKSLIK